MVQPNIQKNIDTDGAEIGGEKKMSLRLPFLVINNGLHRNPHIHNPATPGNLKVQIPVTPQTLNCTGTGTTMNDAASRASYVDLDSSVDSGDDASCVPTEIDAAVQALLSPFSMNMNNTPTCVDKVRVDGDRDVDHSDSDSDDGISPSDVSSPYSSAPVSRSRVGIARTSYSSSNTFSNVAPILNFRNLDPYPDASDNVQFQQDQIYRENMRAQSRVLNKDYANSSISADTNTGTHNIDTSNSNSGSHHSSLGISAFPEISPSSSSNYMPLHKPITGVKINDDSSRCSSIESCRSNRHARKSPTSGLILKNDRFITPGQAFVKKERTLPRHLTPERSEGLGITPPPKTRSSRLLVRHVSPPSNDAYTIFILVIQPSAKLFELIRVNYNPATATIADLLSLVPNSVTEEDLRKQKHIGLCRPRGSSSASRSLTKLDMTASVMARDGTCARILCGEVLVAIPDGYTGKETQILSQHILSLPKMKKLLNRSDPLSPALSKGSRKRSSGSSGKKSLKESPVMLGIQPMMKNNMNSTTGTFSSSILFAPLSSTIQEEGEDKHHQQQQQQRRPPVANQSQPRKNIVSNDYYCGTVNDDVSICSSAMSSTCTPRKFSRGGRYKGGSSIKTSGKSATVLGGGLTAEQIEAIKLEAAAAARVAAEEAYAMRMEELVGGMDISSQQKASFYQDVNVPDDLTLHSNYSWGVPTPCADELAAFPSSILLNNKKSPSSTIVTGSSPATTLGASSVRRTPGLGSQIPPQNYSGDYNSPQCPRSESIRSASQKSDHESSIPDIASNSGHEEVSVSDYEVELVSATMQGFMNSAIQAVTTVLNDKVTNIRRMPDDTTKSKLALKAMMAACVVFLSSQLASVTEDADDVNANIENIHEKEDGNDEEDEKEEKSDEMIMTEGAEAAVNEPFRIADLQHVLFWFMFMVQGQNYITKHKSKRKRRSWNPRVKAIR